MLQSPPLEQLTLQDENVFRPSWKPEGSLTFFHRGIVVEWLTEVRLLRINGNKCCLLTETHGVLVLRS